MDVAELIKQIKHIEIKARTLSNHIFAGDYHTTFKGRGMSFSEVREYSYGDDIRTIDWNVSARFGHPYIKVFEEERELTMMLLIDVSKSSLFGTGSKSKLLLATEIAATLAFSAMKNNDKVGAIFFDSGIRKYLPAKKGKEQILLILRTLLTIKPQAGGTNLALCLQTLQNVMKRKSISFIISDFITPDFKKMLDVCAKRHEMVGLHLYDPADENLPNLGLLHTQDIETGKTFWLDTSNKKNLQQYKAQFTRQVQATKDTFTKSGVRLLSISTNHDYIKKLHTFFKEKK